MPVMAHHSPNSAQTPAILPQILIAIQILLENPFALQLLTLWQMAVASLGNIRVALMQILSLLPTISIA